MSGTSAGHSEHLHIALSDVITKRFRDVLGLWYDEFRGVWGPYLLNGALLSNGESLLMLTFHLSENKRPPREREFSKTVNHPAGKFVVFGEMREDSRSTIDANAFDTIIEDAIGDFDALPSDVLLRNAVALLSMEVQYNVRNEDDPRDLLRSLLEVYPDACPEYRGIYADDPRWTLFKEPGVWWGQATFEHRVDEALLVSRLRRVLPTLPSRIGGTQNYWRAIGHPWLKRIGLLARHF